jgi:transcriptional regulator with GAF, ATPase, and Fis domain
VLQEKQYERVGEERTRTVDVRIIAATNRDLKKAVEAGRFREDLFYRLNVFPLQVPPLRERREDISLLASHFLEQGARRLHLPLPKLTEAHARLLQLYHWPGNVRELQNATERALILAQRGELKFDLPVSQLRGNGFCATTPGGESAVFTETELRLRERQNVLAALERAKWKVHGEGGAAELLGLKPTTLISRMKKMGLKRNSC